MQNTIGKIDTWFPKSVYVAENLLLDHLSVLEDTIKRENKNVCNRTSMQQVNSSHLVNDQLFLLQEFKPLVDAIVQHAWHYLKALGYSEEQMNSFSMQNMWSNTSYEGDYLFPHNHAGAILSGAFYIKAPTDSKIKFFNNPTMAINPKFYNELNYQYASYECIPGRLLLFKSDFLHGTERQSAGEKIVISFNIGR